MYRLVHWARPKVMFDALAQQKRQSLHDCFALGEKAGVKHIFLNEKSDSMTGGSILQNKLASVVPYQLHIIPTTECLGL